jgi:hypothetical protein
MNTFLKLVTSLFLTILCFIPTELWLLVHYIAGPIGFWQNLVLVGLGLYFLGALQFVGLIFLASMLFMLWGRE